MDLIYVDGMLTGGIDAAGRIYRNDNIVGLAKDGIVYNLYSWVLGFYHDEKIFDCDNREIAIVSPKGIITKGTVVLGDVAGCDDKNRAAATLLLLLNETKKKIFYNEFKKQNNCELLALCIEKIRGFQTKKIIQIDPEAIEVKDFRRVNRRIDMFMDPKWEEFIAKISLNETQLDRLLNAYPNFPKHLRNHFLFDRDNHYLNFAMSMLVLKEYCFDGDDLFVLQNLFKSANEGFELAIEYCNSLFDDTNLIDNATMPLKPVYYCQLSEQTIEEMFKYLETEFAKEVENVDDDYLNNHLAIRNCFKKSTVNNLAVDYVTKSVDIIYSDCWLNIINCFISELDFKIGEELLNSIKPLTEGIIDQIIINESKNPYIQYLYGVMTYHGINLEKNQVEGLKFLSFSANKGYDLAIAFINHLVVDEDWDKTKYKHQSKLPSNRVLIVKELENIRNYIKDVIVDSNKDISIYNGKPYVNVEKQEVNTIKKKKDKKKQKVEKELKEKSQKLCLIISFIFALILFSMAIVLILYMFNIFSLSKLLLQLTWLTIFISGIGLLSGLFILINRKKSIK